MGLAGELDTTKDVVLKNAKLSDENAVKKTKLDININKIDDLFKNLDEDSKKVLIKLLEDNPNISLEKIKWFTDYYQTDLEQKVIFNILSTLSNKLNSSSFELLFDKWVYTQIGLILFLNLVWKNELDLLKFGNFLFFLKHLSYDEWLQYYSVYWKYDLFLKLNEINYKNYKNISILNNINIDQLTYILKTYPNIDFKKILEDFRDITFIYDILKQNPGLSLDKFYFKINYCKLQELWLSESFLLKFFERNALDNEERLYKLKSLKDKEWIKKLRSDIQDQLLWISEIISKVEKEYEIYPDISLKQLIDKVLQNPEKYTVRQKVLLISKIGEYYIKVKKIDQLLIKYKWKYNELLEYVYGKKVNWKLFAERHSAWLVFYVYNKNDYVKLHWNETAKESWWFKTQWSTLDELEGSITFVNWKKEWRWSYSEKTKIHEARHALNDIIFTWNYDALERAKDEIIAYITDWSSINRLKEWLLDENWLYNYYEDLKNSNPEKYRELWNKHVEKVDKMIDNAYLIKQFFPDKHSDILAVFEPKQWKELIKDIQANKLKLFLSKSKVHIGNIYKNIFNFTENKVKWLWVWTKFLVWEVVIYRILNEITLNDPDNINFSNIIWKNNFNAIKDIVKSHFLELINDV